MNFEFRPLAEEHFPLITQWLNEPHVRSWLQEEKNWTLRDVALKYSAYINPDEESKPIHCFIIFYQGMPIGYIQYYTTSKYPRLGAALDFYIGEPDYLRKGLGTQCLKEFLQNHVFKTHSFCIVDPDSINTIAIRTYEKAGFVHHSKVEDFLIMLVESKRDL